MKWLGDNEDLQACEENKTKIEHDLHHCEADIDELKSSFLKKIDRLEDYLQLAQDNIRLLESERDKYTLNEQTIKNLNGNLEQCQREKEHLQGNLIAKQLEVVVLSSNYSVCEKNKTKTEHKLDICEADIDELKSNSLDEITTLEERLKLAQDNIRLLKRELDKYTLNEQTIEKLNANLDQCQREKEHLQGNLIAKQLEVVVLSSNYSVCEKNKTKTEHKLDICEADIDELKSNSLEEIKTLEERLQLAQDNIHLLKKELDKCTLNEQTIEKLNASLEQQRLAEKQLEVVMLSSNYSVCLNKLETCTGHLSTCKANLQNVTQQYKSCLRVQTREKNQKDQCAISLTKCELQAKYVVRDYSMCTSKLNKCDKDLKTCKERHCFGFKY